MWISEPGESDGNPLSLWPGESDGNPLSLWPGESDGNPLSLWPGGSQSQVRVMVNLSLCGQMDLRTR